MTTIAERIQLLFNKNNEVPSHVLPELKLSRSALSEWKSGKANPSADAVIKLSQHFDVSTDYILTGKIHESDLFESEKALVQLFRSLPDSNQKQVRGYIEGQFDALKSKKP